MIGAFLAGIIVATYVAVVPLEIVTLCEDCHYGIHRRGELLGDSKRKEQP